MRPLLVAYLVLAGLALIQSAIMLLAAWEHRRYAHSRSRQSLWYEGDWPNVTVFAPCKGLDLEWEKNLRALFEQEYPKFQLVFVVESESDPAYEAIRCMLPQFPSVQARVEVAGLADNCSQKVHNLREATARLDAPAEVLAFVDSDARPPRDWLHRMIHRLRKSKAAAVTGYRWFVPLRDTWTNRLLVSLNGAVAGLLGPHRHNMIWGGSWAMARNVFEAVGVRDAWSRSLSDDLSATRAIRAHGQSVAFEPHCWLPAVVDTTLGELVTFVRRQYLIARLHTPTQWWLAFGGSLLRSGGFWAGAVLSVFGLASGGDWVWWPIGLTGLHYLSLAAREFLRHNAVAPFLLQHKNVLGRSMLTGVFAAPLVSAIETAILASSALGWRIRWRGIDYLVHKDGTVSIQNRQPAQSTRLVQPILRPDAAAKPIGGDAPAIVRKKNTSESHQDTCT